MTYRKNLIKNAFRVQWLLICNINFGWKLIQQPWANCAPWTHYHYRVIHVVAEKVSLTSWFVEWIGGCALPLFFGFWAPGWQFNWQNFVQEFWPQFVPEFRPEFGPENSFKKVTKLAVHTCVLFKIWTRAQTGAETRVQNFVNWIATLGAVGKRNLLSKSGICRQVYTFYRRQSAG